MKRCFSEKGKGQIIGIQKELDQGNKAEHKRDELIEQKQHVDRRDILKKQKRRKYNLQK